MAQRVTKWISDLDDSEFDSKKEADAYDAFLGAKADFMDIVTDGDMGEGGVQYVSADDFVEYLQGDSSRVDNVLAIVKYVEKTK